MLRSMTVLGLAGLMSLTCVAQSESSSPEKNGPKKFYHLSFLVQELDNERVINSRSYSMIMRDMDERSSSIRAGEKVPFSSSSGTSTQWQQVDVGVNIDCRNLEVAGDKVALQIRADVSSVMESHEANSPPASVPIIRNNQWESKVILPLKQTSVLFSSDDPASKRKMQLQLMVTPIR